MAKLKTFKELLEDIQQEELLEAKGDIDPAVAPAPAGAEDDLDDDEMDDDEEKDENLKDVAADGKGHYTADDLREIVDYCYTLIEKEQEEDQVDGDGDGKTASDLGEVGLDLIYEYADLLPETVINQIVDDLKDTFEIEDTMLEGIIEEGSAFFTKSSKGPAAKAAKALLTSAYKKNKSKIKKRNKKWRNSELGAKIAALHKKIFKGAGNLKGKRVHAKEEPKAKV
jgi:ribosomal protein L12E/L44/L45/RPP1/RPP2